MGTVTKTDSITAIPSSYDTSHYSWNSVSSSYPMTNAYTNSSSTTYVQVSWKTGSGAETYVYMRFDFSAIPENATITSVSATAKGYVSTTNSSRVTTRQMQLCTGTTLKGSALTMSTSTSAQTFSSPGTWTRAELQSAGVRYYVKRGTSNTTSSYNLRIYGAEMTVNYSWQETTYTITVNNSTSANVIASDDEPVQGDDVNIIADTITGITVKDNGTDVTNQFVAHEDTGASYTVTQTGTYGFSLNSNNYYQSGNTGVDKSAAVCRVNFNVPVSATITFTYINYAEQGYDFGVFGDIDIALNTDYYPAGSSGATISDSSYKLACNTSTYNSSSAKTLTYSMSAGEHFIDVKYSKDDASASNNDTLQFKVDITLDEPFTPGTHYYYTISSIQADHTIVVSNATATDTIYFKSNGAWVAVTKVYKKVDGSWVQQSSLTNVFDTNTNYVKGN